MLKVHSHTSKCSSNWTTDFAGQPAIAAGVKSFAVNAHPEIPAPVPVRGPPGRPERWRLVGVASGSTPSVPPATSSAPAAHDSRRTEDDPAGRAGANNNSLPRGRIIGGRGRHGRTPPPTRPASRHTHLRRSSTQAGLKRAPLRRETALRPCPSCFLPSSPRQTPRQTPQSMYLPSTVVSLLLSAKTIPDSGASLPRTC